MTERFTVLTSFALDKLINSDGEITSQQEGGPGFYICRVLEDEGVLIDLHSPPKFNVEIIVTAGGEVGGRIPNRPQPVGIDFATLDTSVLIISTLLDDFDLEDFDRYRGQIFLDIQGYVRDGTAFGKRRLWTPSQRVQDSIYCIKATEEELAYLPQEFVQTQKQKLLLITRGSLGCELYVQGKKSMIAPKKVIKAPNTVGAGDTFFAGFVIEFLRTNNAIASVYAATEKTAEFLANKVVE